ANQWLNGVHVDETLGKKYSQQGCTLQQRDREHGSYDISLDGQMLTIQTRDFWTISDADHLSIVKGYDARNITLQIDLSKVGPELLLSKDCVKIKIERNGFCKHFSDVDVLSAGQVAKAVAIEVATSAQSSQNGSELLPIYLESLYSKLKPGESLARRDIKTALDQAVATVREEIIAGQQDKEVQDRLNEMVKAFDAMHPITPDIQKST
ncbi:MAG: hypothetical protein JWO53_1183, partial [Chlamydiia bacterium]|nr:hypothetical protein [Chlamydiia bacterium]